MKRRNLYSLLIVAGTFFASCNPDSVEDTDFNFSVENNTTAIYAGDPVTFTFGGNPDYIVFYSGEFGNRYANKDRKEVTMESASLSSTIRQQYYTGGEFKGQMVYIYASEDFNGVYTKDAIEAATWTELTGKEEGKIDYPTCEKKSTEIVSGKMDFSIYKNKPFHLAIRYYIPQNAIATATQPRVDIEPFTIEKTTTEGQTFVINNIMREFGFQFVQKIGNLKTNLNMNDTRLLVQPQNSIGSELDIWAISQKMNLETVSPDMGTPVKSLDSKTSSYSYTYAEPGEYTVTFVASNANMWNTQSLVREMKIVVKERTGN